MASLPQTSNLHVVLNNFKNDGRVLKITRSIAAMGLFKNVYVAALWEEGVQENEFLDASRQVWRIPLKSRSWSRLFLSQVLKYIEWVFQIFVGFKNRNISLVHCHDLSALPVGILFKLLCRSKIVYDAHEFQTEQEGLRTSERLFSLVSEFFLIKFADEVVTVSEGIATHYMNRYNIKKPTLILNCPPLQTPEPSDILRKNLGIPDEKRIFIYHGGLSPNRGIGNIVEAFKRIRDMNAVLVLMGFGVYQEKIKKDAEIHKNIYFHPPVPPDELMQYLFAADIGVLPYLNTSLNHYYCLPNKFFEYAMAGLPVLVNNLAELRKLVEKFDCGKAVKYETADAWECAINSIAYEDITSYSRNARKMANRFNWENQEKKLQSLYTRIMNK